MEVFGKSAAIVFLFDLALDFGDDALGVGFASHLNLMLIIHYCYD